MSEVDTGINTRVVTMQDVERSLEKIKEILSTVKQSQNPEITAENTGVPDEPGSIKIVPQTTELSHLEIMTEKGWQKARIGKTPVILAPTEEKSEIVKKEDIDEIEVKDATTGDKRAKDTIYDNKSNKFVLPRPDYDSGWFFFDWSESNIDDAPYSINHDVGVLPTLVKVYFAPGQGSGTLGDAVADVTIKDFQEMTNGFSATWASSSYDRIGIIWSLDANRIRFSAGDSASMYTMSRTWGSSGKYEAENGSIRVYIWK